MSFARKYTEFQDRGGVITAISVDTPDQNRAMIEKLLLPFKVLSDPEGERAIKLYGVWNERGRIALPAVVVVGRDRGIRYLYTGQDFADRPGDQDILEALDRDGGSEGVSDGTR